MSNTLCIVHKGKQPPQLQQLSSETTYSILELGTRYGQTAAYVACLLKQYGPDLPFWLPGHIKVVLLFMKNNKTATYGVK